MNELQRKKNLPVLHQYMYEISRIQVAGTSIFQVIGNEILEEVKASMGQCNAHAKCKCTTTLRNTVTAMQTKLIQSPESFHDNETDGNTQLDDIRENEARDNLTNGKMPEKQNSVIVKKRKRTRDERFLNTSRSRSARASKKNISHSSKIPHVESKYDLQNKKKSSLHAPHKLNFSYRDYRLPGRAKQPNPVKKPYQKENIPAQGFYYKRSTRSNVNGGDKDYQSTNHYHTVLKKMSRTGGVEVEGTIIASFLKKYSSNLAFVEPKRRTLYSPSQWMSSSEFASLSFEQK